LEGAYFIKTGELLSLSEQQLVDCSKPENNGCNGGLMDNAFTYAESNPLEIETDYPYRAVDDQCTFKQEKGKVRVTAIKDVPANDLKEMKKALTIGPISVAIQADTRIFQTYASGVLNSPDCGTHIDHGVLAVGYGTSPEGLEYFLVKNSWGE
jgi:C1A family cysteine protease